MLQNQTAPKLKLLQNQNYTKIEITLKSKVLQIQKFSKNQKCPNIKTIQIIQLGNLVIETIKIFQTNQAW